MRLIRYRSEYRDPILALHRSAIEGFTLGISQQQDEADLVAVEDIFLRSGGEFLLGIIDERLVAMGGLSGSRMRAFSSGETTPFKLDLVHGNPAFVLDVKFCIPTLSRMRVSGGVLKSRSETAAVEADEPQFLTEAELQLRERDNLLRILNKANWKIKGPDGAAEFLGVKPTTLLSRIEKWGLKKPAAS